MIHLFAGLQPESIRLMPFITTINRIPSLRAHDLGLHICPSATIDCLPGVASYVGADITAGVLSSGMCQEDKLSLFIDIGTNGEIVLGDCNWLITCACSAGPAFEGAGVLHGMRATQGAIEEVWIHPQTYEPTIQIIGSSSEQSSAVRPRPLRQRADRPHGRDVYDRRDRQERQHQRQAADRTHAHRAARRRIRGGLGRPSRQAGPTL